MRLARLALGWRGPPGGVWPHPPHQSRCPGERARPDPGGICAGARGTSLTARASSSPPIPAEVSRIRGRAANRPAPPVGACGDLVTTRSPELCPDPFFSDTSCRDIVAAPVGGPGPTSQAGRSRPTTRSISPPEPATGAHDDGEVSRDHVSGSGSHRTHRWRGARRTWPTEVGGAGDLSRGAHPLARAHARPSTDGDHGASAA
jgi:hypothetical protein